MIRLGHNLGVKVVAEGVETAEQAAFLRENECDEIQGYYIGKPMKATLFANMLARENVEKRKLA
jgi:EAL domain-containing protein (putative c-di-GMP-specific phosphodiesterase class I)